MVASLRCQEVCVLDLYHWFADPPSTRGPAGQLLTHALSGMQLGSFSHML